MRVLNQQYLKPVEIDIVTTGTAASTTRMRSLKIITVADLPFSTDLDEAVRNLGISVLKTPVRTPTANAFCERLIGTVRHECLDYMIPISERHLWQILREWNSHYNRGRPHSSLGPGILDQRNLRPPDRAHPHRLRAGEVIRLTPVLAGCTMNTGGSCGSVTSNGVFAEHR